MSSIRCFGGGTMYSKPSLVPSAFRGQGISLTDVKSDVRLRKEPSCARRRVAGSVVRASWSPPEEPAISPSSPPEFRPPEEPVGPQRGPAEFTPPEVAPPPNVSPSETPGRPVRPPDIPDPEKDPMRDPDRRRELVDPEPTSPDSE